MSHETRPRTLQPHKLAPLAAWLADRLGAERATVESADLLAGGAVGETWRLSVHVSGGAHDGAHAWVLKTDAVARIPMSHDRANEFACLSAAHYAGVLVPEPIAACADASVIGAPFSIAGLKPGIAQARKLVRDPILETHGDALAERLGAELARLHAIRPPHPGVGFLPIPEGPAALAQIANLRALLDTVSEPRPALEYVLAWLERNAPPASRIVLCHGDFRTGNFLADRGRLTGILDWEFCHWGDPHEDIAWFCARCWRFGADAREAGGVGSREAFYRGYNSLADAPLDPALVHYWEVWAAARWAVVALLQGERHVSGAEPSLELLLTGLMAPEMEYDALTVIVEREKSREAAAHG